VRYSSLRSFHSAKKNRIFSSRLVCRPREISNAEIHTTQKASYIHRCFDFFLENATLPSKIQLSDHNRFSLTEAMDIENQQNGKMREIFGKISFFTIFQNRLFVKCAIISVCLFCFLLNYGSFSTLVRTELLGSRFTIYKTKIGVLTL